ncbi:MAG: hypothetical protein MZV64_04095 [Ignavibacteriales bacterium]|nr:hypothetical protein [Ignavibacteriales bacterium]
MKIWHSASGTSSLRTTGAPCRSAPMPCCSGPGPIPERPGRSLISAPGAESSH